MKSAEEYLLSKNIEPSDFDNCATSFDGTVDRMEDYAKQKAIEFDKWVRINYTWEEWMKTNTDDAYNKFTSQLLDKFNSERG